MIKDQTLLQEPDQYQKLETLVGRIGVRKILLVCDSSIKFLTLDYYFSCFQEKTGIEVIRFQGFAPNPLYESVVEGVRILNENRCSMIIAVGGGSAMDVAKCIKLYSNMAPNKNYLEQPIVENKLVLIAIPTTAGTGSETTRFAVIYFNGTKQSINHVSCIPDYVVLDPSLLKTLPSYQKKVTMMDAFCHAIESYWSVNSTEESKEYSRKAISIVLENITGYLENKELGNKRMQMAAYFAGKAIDITQTTAAHAMSYKITSLYGLAHGHAVALCLPKVWTYMINHFEDCIDPRGKVYLAETFVKIADCLGVRTSEEAIRKFYEIRELMDLKAPDMVNYKDLEILTRSVNPDRLKNNPIKLEKETLYTLYKDILKIRY